MTHDPADDLKQLRHERIASALRRDVIRQLRPGDQLPSIAKLSRQFSVSEITLRNALLSLQQDGLIDIQHGRGSFVTEQEAGRPIGLITMWDLTHPRMSPFYMKVMHGLTDFCAEHGLTTRKYFGQVTPPEGGSAWPAGEGAFESACPELLADLQQNRLGGLVLLASRVQEPWKHHLERNAIPAVTLGFQGTRNWQEDPAVRLDYPTMLRSSTQYLAQQGRTRVAALGWGSGEGRLPGEHSMAELCRAACHEAGLELREPWLKMDVHPSVPGAGWQSLREAWSAFAVKPDGLLILDDMLQYDTTLALAELGVRVPEQLLVVSHANNRVPSMTPFPVVRVEFSLEQICDQLGAALLEAIHHPDRAPEPRLIAPSLAISAAPMLPR